MRAVAINEFGGRDKLKVMDLPVPQPGADEVQIRIHAAGVNPVDWKIREGMLKEMIPHAFPLIPGWDAAGVITAVGSGAKRLADGDEVFAYCRKPVVKDGAYAEYIVLPEEQVALKPRTMSFEEAGTVPLACLTAYQCLFDAGKLKEKEAVLIHAAAGGVGSFAVQLAADCGARTIGTARDAHHDYLSELGLEMHVDYSTGDFRTAVRTLCPDGVDLVIDAVGGKVLTQSCDVIRPEGRIVSIVDPDGVKELAESGRNASFVFVEPIREELERMAGMIDASKLRTSIAANFSLDEAAQAHEMSEKGHTQGKIVLNCGP